MPFVSQFLIAAVSDPTPAKPAGSSGPLVVAGADAVRGPVVVVGGTVVVVAGGAVVVVVVVVVG
ncbi:MAG: hypothetical protein GXP34_00230, partial [Actinobacteria bacterium]|nr:hypothetical protein [Actinomycetota bacterium]